MKRKESLEKNFNELVHNESEILKNLTLDLNVTFTDFKDNIVEDITSATCDRIYQYQNWKRSG